jgi:CRISPR-associated protein Cmr1
MRLKKPGGMPPKLAQAMNSGLCKSFRVELITPLYGGGVETGKPDEAMPIRVSAIRGQLRFWWRVLNPLAKFEDGKFEDEKKIWGGMGDKDAVASRVHIRVAELTPKMPQPKPCAKHTFFPNKKKPNEESFAIEWLPDIVPKVAQVPIGYALFPGQGEAKKDKDTGKYQTIKPPHEIFLPGLNFTLEIRVDDDALWKDVLPALRWWASFGGLGARTRRGLGSVKVDGLEPVTEAEIPEDFDFVPYRAKSKDAIDAWTSAVGRLQRFRQGTGKGEGRNSGSGNRPGRSYWPEADSVRQMTGYHCVQPQKNHSPIHPIVTVQPDHAFPRAIFGLPIIMDFPNDAPKGKHPRPTQDKDPLKTTLTPIYQGKEKERMSSPLILKAMWVGGNNYHAIALVLPNHTQEMGLHIEYNENKNLRPDQQFSADMNTPDDWYSHDAKQVMVDPPLQLDGSVNNNPLKNRSGDVLQDFLAFFTEGDKTNG